LLRDGPSLGKQYRIVCLQLRGRRSDLRRFVWVALALILLTLVAAPAAQAEKRVALVIGNGAYTHAPELTNPRNDAEDFAAALKTLGVEVMKDLDLNKAAMDSEIRKFSAALSGADVGIFFYSGHGLQVSGTNYLVPVDAELSTADASTSRWCGSISCSGSWRMQPRPTSYSRRVPQ
jgi:hypothetical protein